MRVVWSVESRRKCLVCVSARSSSHPSLGISVHYVFRLCISSYIHPPSIRPVVTNALSRESRFSLGSAKGKYMAFLQICPNLRLDSRIHWLEFIHTFGSRINSLDFTSFTQMFNRIILLRGVESRMSTLTSESSAKTLRSLTLNVVYSHLSIAEQMNIKTTNNICVFFFLYTLCRLGFW